MRRPLLIILLCCLVSIVNGFEVGNALLRVNVHQGDFVNLPFEVSSLEGGDFALSVESIEGVFLFEDSFYLEPGQDKLVSVGFDSRILAPDVYVGNIRIVSGDEYKLLPVIFEVESKEVLFDADIEIPLKYLEVGRGDNIVIDVEIFDLTRFELESDLGETEVQLEFVVLGSDGKIISSDLEDVLLDDKTTVTKTFNLPEDIVEGDYFITVAVKYLSSVGTSSSSFSVNEKKEVVESRDYMFYIIIALLVVLVLIFLYSYYLKQKLDFSSGGKSRKSKKSKKSRKELTGRAVNKMLKGKA